VSKDTDVREKKSDAKAQNSLPADFFDPGVSKFGEDSDSGDDVRGEVGRGEGGGSSVASQPTAGGSKTEEKSPANSNKKVGLGAESLPEGFFDDPKLDAKARKVEYRDKMEDEWEKFQKSIQKEKDVSEAIQHEEDEEAQVGRDLTEVQEQVECFQRAETLRLKQEELLEKCSKDGTREPAALKDDRISQSVGGGALDDSEDDSGGSDLDDLEMDWRAKHS
jgi:zinc finger protein 830